MDAPYRLWEFKHLVPCDARSEALHSAGDREKSLHLDGQGVPMSGKQYADAGLHTLLPLRQPALARASVSDADAQAIWDGMLRRERLHAVEVLGTTPWKSRRFAASARHGDGEKVADRANFGASRHPPHFLRHAARPLWQLR